MKKDFKQMFSDSEESTEKFANRLKMRNILYDNIIRLIAPLF